MTDTVINREINVHVGWPSIIGVIVVVLSIVSGISYDTYATNDREIKMKMLELENKQWLMLYAKMQEGCANPDNQLAQTAIKFRENQQWNCTPYFKQRQAPKVPDAIKSKKKRRVG